MSSSEERPGAADDPLDADRRDPGTPPPAPPDAPTQVGIPVPAPAPGRTAAAPPPGVRPPPTVTPPPDTPRGYAAAPPPAVPPPGYREREATGATGTDGGPSPLVIVILALLLIAALVLAGVLAFNVFGPPPAPDPTASPPRSALSPAPVDGTADPVSPGATLPTGPSPAPGDASPRTPDVTITPVATDPQARLLGHVPPDLRDSCELASGTPPARAIATCQADDGTILVTYFLYDDEDAMSAAYDDFADASGVERDSGRCSEPETWPSEGSYSVQDEPAGRVLCMQISDAPTIYWTDGQLQILTWAVHVNGDAERLYEFWEREAGPAR